MKKVLLLFVANIVLAITALAAPAEKTMGETEVVSISKQTEDQPGGHPHAPARSLFYGELDTDFDVLFVNSIYPEQVMPFPLEGVVVTISENS